jgi:hypothetical protein
MSFSMVARALVLLGDSWPGAGAAWVLVLAAISGRDAAQPIETCMPTKVAGGGRPGDARPA